ncbi:MAG: GNAT family N-acetyltransferase, partial [Acidimicrobiia bacterium]
ALVERMVATARAAGHVKMIVHTETDNDRAVGFYGAMGFTTVGSTVEDVEGTHVDVWELRRDL